MGFVSKIARRYAGLRSIAKGHSHRLYEKIRIAHEEQVGLFRVIIVTQLLSTT